MNDLTGMKFGRLTVIEKTDKRYKGCCVIWKCKCDCGNIAYVSSNRLKNSNVTSCGCREKECREETVKRLKQHIKENYIDDTRLDLISNNKLYKNNTTGVKGVYETKLGTYQVTINFQKKRHYLGTFRTKEEAVKVRKAAEEKYFKPAIEEFNKKSNEK